MIVRMFRVFEKTTFGKTSTALLVDMSACAAAAATAKRHVQHQTWTVVVIAARHAMVGMSRGTVTMRTFGTNGPKRNSLSLKAVYLSQERREMSLKEVTMYRVECDHEGCPRSAQDESPDDVCTDQSTAEDDALYEGWFCDNGFHYCNDHSPRCPNCGARTTPEDESGLCEDCAEPEEEGK